MKQKPKRFECLLSAPSFVWLIVFFIIPLIIILAISFRNADHFGGIGENWVLTNFQKIIESDYSTIMWRTVWLSFAATLICVLISLPASYYLARMRRKWRNLLLILIIVPFWTNFLIRIFAWKFILHPDGIIKQILVFFNLASDNTLLLYRWETVLLVLIYTHLPFALLPIYAAAEKFDFLLFDAAYDLGASKIQTFYKIFIPGISGGIIASTLVVFIPCLGSYVIPDIVGGTDSEMLGNKIARYAFTDRNLPMASALSAILILAVVIPAIFKLFKKTEETAESINTQMI